MDGKRDVVCSCLREDPIRIGYARVSTGDQHLDLQLDALRQSGCERIFTDQGSGARADRPGLAEALSHLRPDDTLVVWRLDRLGRSLKDLLQRMEDLRERGVAFQSLHESIDTTTPVGKFTFHLFSALAEFERELIRERTRAGLAAARARGRVGGRRRAMTTEKVKAAARLMADPSVSVAEVCRAVGVSRSTLYRYVTPGGQPRGP
jgi:DNA invertase Pin-like site-specific DNA recombinase